MARWMGANELQGKLQRIAQYFAQTNKTKEKANSVSL